MLHLSATTPGSTSTDDEQKSLLVPIGEPFISDFGVHELPGYDGGCDRLVDSTLTVHFESILLVVMAQKQDFSDWIKLLKIIHWSGFTLDLYHEISDFWALLSTSIATGEKVIVKLYVGERIKNLIH